MPVRALRGLSDSRTKNIPEGLRLATSVAHRFVVEQFSHDSFGFSLDS